MPPLRRARSLLLLYVAACHLALCSPAQLAAAVLPDPLDPALVFPSATPAQPAATAAAGATIPAFPEQSDAAAGGSAACPLAPSPSLLPGVTSSCAADDGKLPPRLRCCPALAAWLFAAYAPAALAERHATRPPAAAAAVDMPVPPDDSEACAGAADRALRVAGASLPRPPGGNGTCDVAFCYCGVRLRRLACGTPPADGGQWAPADAAARRLEKDCARPGVPGCSKCLAALTTIKPISTGGGGGAEAVAGKKKKQAAGRSSSESDRDCQLMGLMWLLHRNATRYGAAATAVIRALMAVDEASAAGVAAAAAAGPAAACSLPVDDMPLPAEYAQLNGASGVAGAGCLRLILLLAVSSFRVVYSL